MSLGGEYSSSKIGATRKIQTNTSSAVSVELVEYKSLLAFRPTSFAVKVAKSCYARQTGSATPPADMTLEFELLNSMVWRVDVEKPEERYLHLRGITEAGSVKITDITKVSGTSSDLG